MLASNQAVRYRKTNKVNRMSAAAEAQDVSKDESIESTRHFKDRAERNRQKALLLRKSKVVSHPYKKGYVACIRTLRSKKFSKSSCRLISIL